MNSFKEKHEKESSFLWSPFFGLANSQAQKKSLLKKKFIFANSF
jgi:hypothetical protein